MNIDPITSLVLGMQAKKGIYALLLGSGVSMSAKIPTGWDILMDLISDVYKLHFPGKAMPETPYNWYKGHFNQEPNYSSLIGILAKTPTERNLVLRKYFEKGPNDDENDKEPTPAHHAIARLVKNGHIRVIVTTNFDRLLENALKQAGVYADVLHSEEGIKGAMPLIHSPCTLIKVNGDYMDTRIRNTFSELEESYGSETDALLDRIFDEFGVIVCGWSAGYDMGLNRALTRSLNRRFTTFWLYRNNLSSAAETVIAQRDAVKIKVHSADSFFTELEEKLQSMDVVPITIQPLEAISTRLKKWLPDAKQSIFVDDMIMDEAGVTRDKLLSMSYITHIDIDDVREKIRDMDGYSKRLLHLLAIGCYWGTQSHTPTWKRVIELLMSKPDAFDNALYLYVPLAALYTMLMAFMAQGRYDDAFMLLNKAYFNLDYSRVAIHKALTACAIGDASVLNSALNLYNDQPISEHLFKALRVPCLQVIRVNDVYENIFDKVECLIGLNFNTQGFESQTKDIKKPPGRFNLPSRVHVKPELLLADDLDGLLTAGFFNSDIELYRETLKQWTQE